MKYCQKCGTQLIDEASVCIGCGCLVSTTPAAAVNQKAESGLATAAKILMILSTVFMGLFLYLIPLAWCIPMTVSYHKKIKNGEPVSTGFKVCTLIFVNTIAGILMLCDNDH